MATEKQQLRAELLARRACDSRIERTNRVNPACRFRGCDSDRLPAAILSSQAPHHFSIQPSFTLDSDIRSELFIHFTHIYLKKNIHFSEGNHPDDLIQLLRNSFLAFCHNSKSSAIELEYRFRSGRDAFVDSAACRCARPANFRAARQGIGFRGCDEARRKII